MRAHQVLNKIKRFFMCFRIMEDAEYYSDRIPTGKYAKKRLQKAVLQSHLDISPHMMDMLEEDILAAFKRYVYINEKNIDMKWTRCWSEDGMREYAEVVAHIPIGTANSNCKVTRIR